MAFSSPSPPSISNPSPKSTAAGAPTSASHFSDWRRSPISHHALIRSSPAVAERFERCFATMATKNSYESILTTLWKPGGGEFGKYFSLPTLDDPRIDRLSYSIRILLESAIRNCDGFQVMEKDMEKILDLENTAPKQVEIPFKPAKVLLQDFSELEISCL